MFIYIYIHNYVWLYINRALVFLCFNHVIMSPFQLTFVLERSTATVPLRRRGVLMDDPMSIFWMAFEDVKDGKFILAIKTQSLAIENA